VQLEFWFDFSCPYAYLASKRVVELAAAHEATLVLCPMLLGGVFRAIGAGEGPLRTLSAAKKRHLDADLARWSSELEAPLSVPATHPMRSVTALRILLGLPTLHWQAAMDATFDGYWRSNVDITNVEVLTTLLEQSGIPGPLVATAVSHSETEAAKSDLVTRTELAVSYGIFGAPAMRVVSSDMPALLFWGQDRLPWVAAALAGWRADSDDFKPSGAHPIPIISAKHIASARPAHIDMYFDIASPYAYFALTQLPSWMELTPNVSWRLVPIVLGALFRDIGQADVPLFSFPAAKRSYIVSEISRWSRWYGVPYQFPQRFPQRTLTAQRLIYLAVQRAPLHALPLATALASCMWAHNGDVADEAQLSAVLQTTLNLDFATAQGWIEDTQTSAVKQALIDATHAASTIGVFGVPTWITHENELMTGLFWGQDRVGLMLQSLSE
jgi:2-hydroxychromene-2-carboxylate isomerase